MICLYLCWITYFEIIHILSEFFLYQCYFRALSLTVLYLILLMSHVCGYLISWILVENLTHKIVWSVFWHHSWKQICGVFWHWSSLQSIDFLTSTGWPILPFNSYTNYPNLAQTPQVKTQSHKSAPSSDVNCNWGAQASHIAAWLTTYLEFLWHPLQV